MSLQQQDREFFLGVYGRIKEHTDELLVLGQDAAFKNVLNLDDVRSLLDDVEKGFAELEGATPSDILTIANMIETLESELSKQVEFMKRRKRLRCVSYDREFSPEELTQFSVDQALKSAGIAPAPRVLHLRLVPPLTLEDE